MLVGLTGLPRAGKDSFAAALVRRGWHRYALADPMREALLALDPFVIAHPGGSLAAPQPVRLSTLLWLHKNDWDSIKASEYGADVRRLLERFGTEAGREFYGEDHWIDVLIERTVRDGINLYEDDVVITDVRFRNEAEYVREVGGKIVKIERPGTVKTTHISSAGIAPQYVDYFVTNEGTLDELDSAAEHFLKHLENVAA